MAKTVNIYIALKEDCPKPLKIAKGDEPDP